MNWWHVRLATRDDAGGTPRVDAAALRTVRRAPFRQQLEMHMAQDALDQMADIRREQAAEEADD